MKIQEVKLFLDKFHQDGLGMDDLSKEDNSISSSQTDEKTEGKYYYS